MKKIYSLLLLVVGYTSFGQTIYSENFGTPTANTTAANYITGSAPATFQNSGTIVYSGTTTATSLRTSSPSSGYSGASGNGNVFLSQTTNAGHFFQIDGINTSAFSITNLQLSFGYNTSSTSAAQLIVEQSTNGGTSWIPLTFTPSGTNWTLVTVTGSQIPSSTTLSLRFTQPSTVAVPNSGQFRIDDVKVFNFDPSCTLVLGNPTTACDAVTFGIDTYTVTIPYTGGTSGAYTFIPSSGTVGGDNPATLAAGNIVVSGVTEGTGFNLTITKGTCSYSANAVNAVECKPINTLPFSESFPYTAGGSLNAEQKWSVVNTGDNIAIAAGSLAYPGITAAGNSITFVGVGAESRTLFTSTNTDYIYASFIVTASDLANVTTDLANTYFAFFTDAAGATTNARVWIRKNGNQYQYGLGTGSAPTDWNATLYNAGDIQYIVLSYDFTGNTLSLFINPTIGGSAAPTVSVTPTAPFANLGGFIFRQDTATTTPTLLVDELRIAAIPNFTLGTQQNEITGLKVYPNPVSNGTLFIETSANAEKTVTVFDVLGKQVLSTSTTNNEVNVSSLNAGVYIVNITEEGKTASRKLVIR